MHVVSEAGDKRAASDVPAVPAVRFLRTEQVAALFLVDAATVTRWCREGLFDGAKRIGRRWLIPEAAVSDLVA